jgi:DNA polymerase III subunit beta
MGFPAAWQEAGWRRADDEREVLGMKFTVERDTLAEAVTWAARALPSRPVIPVLGGLLVHAGDDGLTLSCFDYEVSARMRVPAEVAEPGEVLVPGRLFADITRSLPGLPVEFADDPDGITMICGDAAFTVATLPSGEYPELPDLPLLAGVVDGAVLAAAIGQVAPAASRDDTLPVLTAVSLEFTGGMISLAATDRYRLAVRDLGWSPAPWIAGQDRADGRVAVLVPARTLADAARMMSPGVPVRVMLRDGAGDGDGDGDAMIGFECGERRLTTRLLAGEFIRYRSRFPAEFGCTADLPAEAFAEAVRRVSLVAERGTPVQLSFAPGRVTIGAATQGQARAREIVAAEFSGDEPVIAFSPHYLLDGIIAAAAPGHARADAPASVSATVRLQFSSPSKPAVISQGQQDDAGAGEDFRYLVVPQRVQP